MSVAVSSRNAALEITPDSGFTVEVLAWRGLVTYYVLFFLHLESRRVTLGGITPHPTEAWITQMARDAVERDVRSFAGELLRAT